MSSHARWLLSTQTGPGKYESMLNAVVSGEHRKGAKNLLDQ